MQTPEFSVRLSSKWMILRGIFSIAFGFVALTWPGATVAAITLLFGIYALADGIFAIAAGIQQERRRESYGLAILEGIIGIGAGIFTLFWPKITLIALCILTGVWALSTGCLELLAAFEYARISLGPPSKTARWLLGVMGAFSMALGIAIFIWPVLGAITLITLIATYAICFGMLTLAFGFHLRKAEKMAASLPNSTSQAA